MTITVPPRCANSVMVSNQSTSITLLDTGAYPAYSNFLNEVYQWAGTGAAANWTALSTNTINASPLPARTNMAAAWDGYQILMYGGQTGSSTGGILNDSWLLSNTGVWTQLTGPGFSGVTPYGRTQAEMAWLEGTGALLFGGALANGQLLLESWEFTAISGGGTWSQIAVANGAGPAARVGHCLSGNTTGTVVLYGGAGTNSQFQDTWTYSVAAGWVNKAPASSPSVRSGASMSYDSTNSNFVMFGGKNSAGYLQDLWTYTLGTNTWAQIAVANGAGPGGLINAQMEYDHVNSQTLLFGGISATTSYPSNQLWALPSSTMVWSRLA